MMYELSKAAWKQCLEQQLEPVLKATDSRVGLSTYTDMPFGIFLYPPEDEWELRQEVSNLTIRLQNVGKTVQRLSMANFLEQALREAGLSMEEIVEGEIALGPEAVQETIRDILSGTAAGSIPLDELIARAIATEQPTTSHIIFLERVGVLFGLHRPSALLQNLHRKIFHPIVLFYPGQRDGPAGLRFMDETAADHNYRPKLFAA